MPSVEFTRFAPAGDHRCPTSVSGRAGAFVITALAGLFLLLLAAPLASAQVTSSATLRGVVKDPTGAVVRGATVTLTSTQRGTPRQVKTSDDGTYVITSVDPGTYSLKVEAGGFKTYEQPDLTLAPSETRGLDVARTILKQPVLKDELQDRPVKPVLIHKVTIHTQEVEK